MGFEFLGIDEDNNMSVRIINQVHKFKLLYVLEFTSARYKNSQLKLIKLERECQ